MAANVISFRLDDEVLRALEAAKTTEEKSINLTAQRIVVEALGLSVGETVKETVETLVAEAVAQHLASFREEINQRLGESPA